MSRNFYSLFVLSSCTRLLYKSSEFKVFSRIIKNSWAESSVNACTTSGVNKNVGKSFAGWN